MGRPMTQRLLAPATPFTCSTAHAAPRRRSPPRRDPCPTPRRRLPTGRRGDHRAADTETVQAVYAETAAVARGGQVFIDLERSARGLNRWCAEQLEARGAEFLDAPVSGGPAGATAGTLTRFMVGGEQSVLDSCCRCCRRSARTSACTARPAPARWLS